MFANKTQIDLWREKITRKNRKEDFFFLILWTIFNSNLCMCCIRIVHIIVYEIEENVEQLNLWATSSWIGVLQPVWKSIFFYSPSLSPSSLYLFCLKVNFDLNKIGSMYVCVSIIIFVVYFLFWIKMEKTLSIHTTEMNRFACYNKNNRIYNFE